MITDIETHRSFMLAMTPLAVDFSYMWKTAHPDERLRDIINKRSYLVELLQLDKNEVENLPLWRDFLSKAEDLYSNRVPRSRFEQELSAELLPFALSRLNKYYESRMAVPRKYNAGSLKYDPPLDELPRNYCNFHISNLLAPGSFFDDPEYLPHCFMELMEKSEKEYGYDTLHTYTWLNSYPRWLALFPREWQENAEAPANEIIGNLGYWGQLITGSGEINRKAEQYVREHGTLRYKTRRSHCSFKSMRDHLQKILHGE